MLVVKLLKLLPNAVLQELLLGKQHLAEVFLLLSVYAFYQDAEFAVFKFRKVFATPVYGTDNGYTEIMYDRVDILK